MASLNSIESWIADTGALVTKDGDHVLLFKAVRRADYLSKQSYTSKWSGSKGKMLDPYTVGKRLTAPDFLDQAFCGDGLHLCPTPSATVAYNSTGQVMVVEVRKSDIVPLSSSAYNAKCKVRSLRVLAELDYNHKNDPDYLSNKTNDYSSIWAPKPGQTFQSNRSNTIITIDSMALGYAGYVTATTDKGKSTKMSRRSLEKNYSSMRQGKKKKAAEPIWRKQIEHLL